MLADERGFIGELARVIMLHPKNDFLQTEDPSILMVFVLPEAACSFPDDPDSK